MPNTHACISTVTNPCSNASQSQMDKKSLYLTPQAANLQGETLWIFSTLFCSLSSNPLPFPGQGLNCLSPPTPAPFSGEPDPDPHPCSHGLIFCSQMIDAQGQCFPNVEDAIFCGTCPCCKGCSNVALNNIESHTERANVFSLSFQSLLIVKEIKIFLGEPAQLYHLPAN